MVIERHVNIEHSMVSFEGMRISWDGIWAGMRAAARVRSEFESEIEKNEMTR